MGFGLWPIKPAASENVEAMFSTQGFRGGFLNTPRTRFTSRSMGRRIFSMSAGRLRPRTSTPIMQPTSSITTMPKRNHTGERPTVTSRIKNARIMMVQKAPSIVICMSSAADVALPGEIPRRRASSTTSVVPARLSDGAIVFMKKVPNTSGSVARGAICSPTARKHDEYAKLCETYLHSCVRMAATSGIVEPRCMVSTSSANWSPRKNTTANTMMSTRPTSRFLMLNFTVEVRPCP